MVTFCSDQRWSGTLISPTLNLLLDGATTVTKDATRMDLLAGTCRLWRLLHSCQHKQTSMTRACENVRKITTNTWVSNGQPNAIAAIVLVALEEQQAAERTVEIAALAQIEQAAVGNRQYLE